MKPIGSRTPEEQIEYHLKDGRAPDFSVGQRGRVELARFLMEKIFFSMGDPDDLKIVELGCGAGDISGPYSKPRMHTREFAPNGLLHKTIETNARVRQHRVTGYDITPAAQAACAERWPDMTFVLQDVATVEPYDCDIVVMTEFLEHVSNPVKIVKDWLPRARWAIIGHPLDEPDPPIEPGHIWSYTREDWRRWFEIGGHQFFEEFRFPMAGWDAMILGHSARKP